MTYKKNEIWDENVIPFQDDPEDRVHHNYRCWSCGYSEWIPAWVIDEFPWGEEPGFKPETIYRNAEEISWVI